MTERELFFRALASIAGNSAFGNDYQGSYHSITEWAKKIHHAAIALVQEIEDNGYFEFDPEDDEPDQPP